MQADSMQGRPELFVLAGMPRAGTTYVYHALARHPGVHVGARKEFRFFSLNYRRGVDWYERQFAGAPPGTVWADLSPDYFMFDGVVARLCDYHRPLRVALAVRDPAEWVVSLHRHLRTMEARVPPFGQFLESGRYPDFGVSSHAPPAAGFIDGFVRRRLEEFRAGLGDRLLLCDFAFFRREPLRVMTGLERFLGLAGWFDAERLPRGRYNARGPRRFRPWRYLLSRESVSQALARWLPRRLILQVRAAMEEEGPPAARDPAAAEADRRDVAAAQTALAADVAYVRSLFGGSPWILGDGRSFA